MAARAFERGWERARVRPFKVKGGVLLAKIFREKKGKAMNYKRGPVGLSGLSWTGSGTGSAGWTAAAFQLVCAAKICTEAVATLVRRGSHTAWLADDFRWGLDAHGHAQHHRRHHKPTSP